MRITKYGLEMNEFFSNNKVKCFCVICGKYIGVYYKSIIRKTCSKDCYKKLISLKTKGKNNPNYKHGRNYFKQICCCGNEKDYRSKKCYQCANLGFKKGGKGDPIRKREDVDIVVKNSKNYLEVAERLGINRKTVKPLVELYALNIDHFQRVRHRRYNKQTALKIGQKRLAGNLLRNILINECNIKPLCDICGIGMFWEGKPLKLQVHHINGNNYDNREKNLQLLCPNCHTQTSTYTGKNMKKRKVCPVEVNDE